MFIIQPDAEIKDTGTDRGRGVFALRDYKKNDIVEVCPVILLKTEYDAIPAELKNYVFSWSALADFSGYFGVALGYGGMYNHSNPANLIYDAVGVGTLLQFTAVKDIIAGEELTINYNGRSGVHTSEEDYWFDRAGITPIVET